MKTRTVLSVAAIVFLLLSGVILHIPGATPAAAQTDGPSPPVWYAVEQTAASGGNYHLTSLALRRAQGGEWRTRTLRALRVSGTIGGGGGAYRLSHAGQDGPWSNCCCTFLPLVIRNTP